jgi:hypothetical protein
MFCVNCGAVLPDGAQFCTSCGTKMAGTRVVAAPPSPPSPDYNVELAELHQRVVQEELGLLATIDESGYVNFENELGKLYIVLQKSIPEYMGLHCMFYRGETHALQNLRRICNSVNESSLLALLTVDDSCFVVSAKVQLFLAGHGRMPDEILLRGVISRAMSSIKSAVEEFADELRKLVPSLP